MLSVRLKNQQLIEQSFRRPEDIVRWFGAVQAQDYLGAVWALGLRGRELSATKIEDAFTDGRILRTHVLRPTWHFVVADDIDWMVALNAERLQRTNRTYAQRLGIDDKLVTRSRVLIERALDGGGTATRAEIAAVLERGRIAAAGQSLAHLLFELEQQRVVCSGPRRGKQFTYALFWERVPARKPPSREEALATLAQRYFQSHGPATKRDFAWWSGLAMRDVNDAIEMASVDILDSPPTLQRAKGATYLLPNYDEYLIAYRDRGAVIDPERARNLGVFTSREFLHQVVVDGRVAGSWRREITDTRVLVEAWPYSKLTRRDVEALDEQAARYGLFLKRPHELRTSDPLVSERRTRNSRIPSGKLDR